MKKIVILSGNHLCHNPRVMKEAHCLADAGFDVEVLGAWLNADLAARDRQLMPQLSYRYTPVVNFLGEGARARLTRTLLRGRRKLALKAKGWLGCEWPDMLGYGIHPLLRAARSRRADLYIAHSETALWVACKLLAEKRRIGIDMEDWFSEDLPPEVRAERPMRLLRSLEKQALSGAVHRTTTSRAMANALATAYDCAAPSVVYNAFPWAERSAVDGEVRDRRNPNAVSLHWYSQTLGSGRGLEHLSAALQLLHVDVPVEIHLRGDIPFEYRGWLDALVPAAWRERVYCHPTVSNRELLSRIAEHDIGLSLDTADALSRDLTVTNKILQYLQGGLAVVASATAGQREIAAAAADAVHLFQAGNAQSLAACLGRLISSKELLARTKVAALAAARDTFCWEKMAPILAGSVAHAVREAA